MEEPHAEGVVLRRLGTEPVLKPHVRSARSSSFGG